MNAPACRLCGGNSGRLNETGAHNLCAALADRGLPTPSLGTRCGECNGTGRIPRSAAGPALFFEGNDPGTIAYALEAWAPPCAACGGKGRIE